ncbi:HAD-IA family hydrolase [Lysobacter sp. KIS68-7]|uniref:HAD family hydrolase n=1 Tax=Lysobacter sp. KIS68-7 TaxID=2904252 RepID=UPI001E53F7B9|nr:HAD-IA family hydrolase [Lysobacter sp. KIS68-7]UHQ20226.1 HAD-IA family hydrolase [Lysobacter sp. KIS68-7]
MNFQVRAITLDLDDTLWPFAPVGARVEHVLHDWLVAHCPRTAERFPVPEMRRLRETINVEHPHLAHDFSTLRKLTLARAMELAGDDVAQVEPAFEAFFAERNRVQCYPDAIPALERIAARVPVAAVTNGNADLRRIGLNQHFAFQLGAAQHGASKPDPGIYRAACARLGFDPRNVLHVGDDIELDVLGAQRAGLRTCWIHRDDLHGPTPAWPHVHVKPDLAFPTLDALADWLDAHLQDEAACG